ncbi:VOC family protein [Nonomuraea endophytica]|uniref:VOC family protein n=1 Tax=Nonomuraea endophytica TaxID=714136 RepID=UPI0037C9EBAC
MGLHHVGHVVGDMEGAARLYRRLGFTVAPPAYPVLPGVEQPFGVANAHVYLADGFVELVAVLDGVPGEARPIPLRVPEDRLPGLVAAIRAASAAIAGFLERFQGLHIVIADTSDLDAVAARLTADGVGHSGVHAIQRPVETATGTAMEPARYLEISGPLPEGRIGFAENGPDSAALPVEHANGATGLLECVLCVADQEADQEGDREADQAASQGGDQGGEQRAGREVGAVRRRYDGWAGVRIVPASALPGLLPGERPPALPAFVAYAVSVRDLAATERFLSGNGVPIGKTGSGEIFVPAEAALGTAIIFRQES